MSRVIAVVPLRMASARGHRAGRVEISEPEPHPEGGWMCAVRMPGLDEEPFAPIVGEDSMQALALALGFVGHYLRGVRSRGGRVLMAEAEEDFPLEAYFPEFATPSEPPN